MGQVIELCSRCGFDIPADADGCPSCHPDAAPALAALQVAGLALPTRSAHRVPHLRPRRERVERPVRTTGTARAAFGYAFLFIAIALLAASWGWAAGLERFVLAVPNGTVERLADLAELATWASIVVAAAGLVALAAGAVRHVRRHAPTR